MTGKVEIRIDIQAPLDSVFEALTRRSALVAWFAENAHVSRDEKRYDFWGRFTPYAPGPNDGRHPVLSWREGVELIYDWRLRDADTTVAIVLDGSEGVTKLSLSHDAPDRGPGELSLADFWMLSLENLRRYLRDGSAPVRRDYSSALSKTVELALDIEAAPEQVFGALTDPESLKCWMGATAPEVEPMAGGSYRYWQGQGPVEILEIDDNRKLSCLWSNADAPDTIVTWTLDGSRGRTRLTLVHSGFASEREDFRTGWLKHLVWLKESVERGSSWTPPVLLTTDCKA